MTNQQRTAAYDAFLITGALIIGLDASAKETNDPARAALARELAVNSLAQFGFKAPTVEPSPQSALVSNPVGGSIRAATPPATKKSNSNGMLDGIYSGLSSALRVSTGGGLTGDPSRTYVTFYPDGKVYRRVPEGGLEAWDRAAAETDVPALWGTYKPIGPGRWEVRWNESTRVGVVQREGEGLRYEDGMVFPVATCEGLVLDGFYAQPGYERNPKPDFIAFYPDGRFVDDRLIGAGLPGFESHGLTNCRTGNWPVSHRAQHASPRLQRRSPRSGRDPRAADGDQDAVSSSHLHQRVGTRANAVAASRLSSLCRHADKVTGGRMCHERKDEPSALPN